MRRTLASLGALAVVALLAGACTSGKNGDGGSGSPTPTPTGNLAATWYEDVAPIVMTKCAGCHTAGGIAPFSLLTFADAQTVGPSMKSATASRTMPPETVDVSGNCQTYANGRYLTAAEIATIGGWVDGGMKEGNPANAPPGPTPIPTLSGTTTQVDTGFDYTPTTGGNDDYHCFILDVSALAGKYLTGFEVHPGDAAIVHHVVLYSLDNTTAENQAAANDTADSSAGYSCFGGVNANPSRLLMAWAPGGGATTFPANTGIQMPSKLVMQVHYNTTTATGTDRTAVKLQTASSVAIPAQMLFLADNGFSLQPGLADTSYTYDIPVPASAHLYSIFPHMHKLGTSMKLELVHNGTASCWNDVPRWNFNWQEFHNYAAPLSAQAGDTLRVTCHWNTSGQSAPIGFGENTTDEMCVFGLYVTP